MLTAPPTTAEVATSSGSTSTPGRRPDVRSHAGQHANDRRRQQLGERCLIRWRGGVAQQQALAI
jgi:hypothetical protein